MARSERTEQHEKQSPESNDKLSREVSLQDLKDVQRSESERMSKDVPNGSLPPVEITLSSKDMQRLWDKNATKLDADKDGILTEDELDKALKSNKFKDDDALFILALKENFNDLKDQMQFANEGSSSNVGISKYDIEEFSRRKDYNDELFSRAKAATDYANPNFQKLDLNNDGKITKEELKQVIYDPKTSQEDRDGAAAVKNLFGTLRNIHKEDNGTNEDPSISKADVQDAMKTLKKQHSADLWTADNVDWVMDKKARIKEFQEDMADVQGLQKLAKDKYDKLDVDHNGVLSKDDFNFALGSNEFTSEEKALINKMLSVHKRDFSTDMDEINLNVAATRESYIYKDIQLSP